MKIHCVQNMSQKSFGEHWGKCSDILALARTFSRIFSLSDFTWNQSWRIYSLKICHFNKLRLELLWMLIFMNVCKFWRVTFIWYAKFRAPRMAKTAILELPDSPKLISRKIWVTEKNWNFHTVLWCNVPYLQSKDSLCLISVHNHKFQKIFLKKSLLNKNFHKTTKLSLFVYCYKRSARKRRHTLSFLAQTEIKTN